jgi:hypothetical protein
VKDDAEDYPVAYLLYVFLAVVAIAVVAVVAAIFPALAFPFTRLRLESRRNLSY